MLHIFRFCAILKSLQIHKILRNEKYEKNWIKPVKRDDWKPSKWRTPGKRGSYYVVASNCTNKGTCMTENPFLRTFSKKDFL